MSLIKKADIQNRLSTRGKRLVLPFILTGHTDATVKVRNDVRGVEANGSMQNTSEATSTAIKSRS